MRLTDIDGLPIRPTSRLRTLISERFLILFAGVQATPYFLNHCSSRFQPSSALSLR